MMAMQLFLAIVGLVFLGALVLCAVSWFVGHSLYEAEERARVARRATVDRTPAQARPPQEGTRWPELFHRRVPRPSLTAAALDIVDRLWAIDLRRPRLDPAAIEAALRTHYAALGLPGVRVRWAPDLSSALPALFPDCRAGASPTYFAWWERMPVPLDVQIRYLEQWGSLVTNPYAEDVAVDAVDIWTQPRALSVLGALETAAWSAVWNEGGGASHDCGHVSALGLTCTAVAAIEVLANSTAPVDGRWRLIHAACLPLIDACEAGLWRFWPRTDEIVALARPGIWLNERGALHRNDGPAIAWSTGGGLHYWSGIRIPEDTVVVADALTIHEILAERNLEVRRVLLERRGFDRVVIELGVAPVHTDETGALYRIPVDGSEPLCLVHVRDAAAAPDGSRRQYFLRVPPDMERARQAVAWTFGLDETDYWPTIEA